ncbi:MAG: hypothetical protein V1779_01785 [bacterium]
MSYSKLIHEYLDSQLNAVNEDVLFAELAKNPDLRVEFNQQVQLQNVAMSDMRTISPPAESTNAIFTSLGFSIPSGDYLRRIAPNPESGITMRPVGSTFSRFLKKYTATVAAVIITASLTTAVFMLTDNRFAAPSADENSASVQNDIPVVSSQEKADIATVTQSNLTNTFHSQRNSVANSSENTVNSSQQVVDDNSINLASLINNAPPVKTNNSPESENINLMGTNSNNPGGFVNNDVYDPFFNALNIQPVQNFNDGNIAVIVSYSYQSSNVNVSTPGENFVGNNVNITALYKINDNWYVGFSGGAEQFAMDYKLEGYQYQQLPSFNYLGFSAKFALPLKNYFEYGDLITPYAQLFVGTALKGTTDNSTFFAGLGKGQVGITLAPYSKFAFNIGYEYSTFIYNVSGIKSSDKNGLVFGAGLSF